MNMEEIIVKTRDGKSLSREEIDLLVQGISQGSIPDYQVAAWAMAVYFRGMDAATTRDLALSMAHSGDIMDLSEIEGYKVDKHSTGGVGDKTTMVVIPLVAAAGVPAAKMSGRGLGHTGGTIDKFAAIPGFQVELGRQAFAVQVNKIKAAVISQSGNLVPADKKLYALRDVTGTVDSIPLIASSIMSKKLAAGADGIVLDVKVGSGAFMKNLDEARQLARTMVSIGHGANKDVVAVLSDMDQPLGRAVGNALEVTEALDTLNGQGPEDLTELSLYLAAHMLHLAGQYTELAAAHERVSYLLSSGAALQKFNEMVQEQKGTLLSPDQYYGLPRAPVQYPVLSEQEGFIQAIDCEGIGRTAMQLGAGRAEMDDIIDPAAGLVLDKKRGDHILKGEPLAVLHARSEEDAKRAAVRLIACYQIGSSPPPEQPLIFETIYP